MHRPWNRPDLAVYSISSFDGKAAYNMHMITYVTAISMQPKRFICGIYEGTRTRANIERHPEFVLQLLADHQYRLTTLLGKQSGNDIDKIGRLEKRGLVTNWQGFPVLKDSLAFMKLRIIKTMDGGDHLACLCELMAWKNNLPGEPLTTNILRQHKLIRS